MADGPLRTVRIVDLTHVWAGPLGTRILADLGAEVVRVEGPASRGPRVFPEPPVGGFLEGDPGADPWNRGAQFVKLGRNKRSVALDLKAGAGRALFLQLVRHADIVVENFSSRVMASLGLGWDTLAATNPRLIYISMPGFGMTGPATDQVAFGPTVEALSGFTQVLGYGPAELRNTAMALMDPVTALNAAVAATTALRAREADGQGRLVELSLHEGAVTLCAPWLIDQQLDQQPDQQPDQPLDQSSTVWGNRHPRMAPHGVFPCAGPDSWVAIACRDDRDWRSLCTLVDGLEPTLDLPQRRAQEDILEEKIAAWTGPRAAGRVAEYLQAAGVPAGPVNAAPDMGADPQIRARGFFVPLEPGLPVPGSPIHMDGSSSADWTRCPTLGEHNREVLADWLRLDAAAIDALERAGVLADRPPA